MEQLGGENISVLPFKKLKKISDLIFFEGPVLTHFQDKYKKDFLFYWVDVNDDFNRWLVFQVSEDQLYKYLAKQTSLYNIFKSPANDLFYSVEIGDQFGYNNIKQIFKEDLIEKYIPEKDSFFASKIPDIYYKKLDEYQETFLMEILLEKAMYVKAEPSKKLSLKNHGLVDVLSGADFLYGYGISYNNLMAFEVRKEFQNRNIFDNKRINKGIRQISESSQLNLVKTKAASFGIAICPNNITAIDETFLNKEWRDNVFKIFKSDIINIDKKTEEEVDKIVQHFGDGNVSQIFKPIIGLYNNKNIVINITDENFFPKRTVRSLNETIVNKLTKDKPTISEMPVDRLALVKFNNKTGRILGTSNVTLFDQEIQTSWVIDEIRTEKKNYKLQHKLFSAYKIVNSLHILEQEVLNIYATGDSLPEATTDFYNQFQELYERLIPAENKKLSLLEIEMKNYLLLHV